MRLDLDIPESLPDDLPSRAACMRYVRRIVRDWAKVETAHEAWLRKPEIEGNKVAIVQADKAMDELRDFYPRAMYAAMRRHAALEATRSD